MMKENAQLLALVFDFLSKLSEEQLSSLLRKESKLKLDEMKIEKNTPNAPGNEAIEMAAKKLSEIGNREEALHYLQELNFNKKGLQNLAKQCKVSTYSKDTNDMLINKIIESVIGARLKFDALLNTNLNG